MAEPPLQDTARPEPLVSAWRLSKRYGPVVALDEVSIDLVAGEVHAIVGENGAGKSTLAKCIAGAQLQESGGILVGGKEVQFRGRRDSIAAGIGYVPQALSLVGALTLVENLMLARGGFLTDRVAARADLAAAATRLGADLALDLPTLRLSLSEMQLAEIALALAQGARVLLLDEPTSTLGPVEIDRLIACMRELARDGIAVCIVTHRIVEVLNGADRVSVLRGGKLVHHGSTKDLAADALAQLIVGERVRNVLPRMRTVTPGPSRLRAQGLHVQENDMTLLDDVSVEVRSGEIVGIAGVAGPSQPALAQTLVGIRRPTRGVVTIDGVDITGKPQEGAALNVAFVPDKRSEGLVLERSIAENASFMRLHHADFQKFGLRRPKVEESYAQAICNAFDVRPPRPALLAAGLSGGNQQKLLVGREIDGTPSVIVVHGPTQGLDLAAAASIRNRLAAAASAGSAVVVISADLDEILGISDRVVVLTHGRITDTIEVEDGKVDMVRLGRAMTDAA